MSGIADEGSPLDDYFQGTLGHARLSVGASVDVWAEVAGLASDQDDSASWFDATDRLAGPSTPPRNGTRLLSRQSSAHAPSPKLPSSPGAFPSEPFFSSEVAERFKFIIYSSELLDKDWSPRPVALPEGPLAPVEVIDEVPLSPPELAPGGRHLEDLVRLCLERWDISLAALCILLGASLLVGWSWKLPISVILGAAGLWVLPPHPIQRHQSSIKGIPDISHFEDTSSSIDSRTRAPNELIANLEAFLSSCRKLDSALATALERIPRSAPISVHRALRLAIHQHTVDMTDSLASATSSLLTIVDRKELALLGEMYDVPLGMIQTGMVRPPVFSPAIPSPKRTISQAAAASPLRELKTRSLARPASARLSLTPSRPFSADDRFTAMPERTPRLSKRMSWDTPVNGSPLADSPKLDWTRRRRSLRLGQRRIDEVDGESTSSGTSGGRSTAVTSPSLAPIDASPRLPSTPGLESAKYSEASSRQDSPDTRRPATPNQYQSNFTTDRALLPSPMARDKSKRRSLQSLPYSPGSSDLIRPRGSPLAEQPTRSGHAKRKSLHNLPYSPGGGLPWRPDSPTLQELRSGGQGSPSASSPARSLRVESDTISPLTLSALKAACLGLHLKRRRLACCLLGIDLARHRAAVGDILVDLSGSMDMEREVLEGSMSNETQQIATPPPPQQQWPDAPSAFEKHDFAPMTDSTERLAESVRTIRKAMEGLWERSDDVLAGRDTSVAWAAIRADLGEMIRAWEKGRDALPDMIRQERTPLGPPAVTPIKAPITEPEELPAFLKAWDEGSPSPPTPPELEHGSDTTAVETLPAPGIDAVYEADTSVQTRANPLEGLSRDERIRLIKEAREKGMTLKDYVHGEQPDGRQDKAYAAAESMVVDELKGMIDMIRQKKNRLEPSL